MSKSPEVSTPGGGASREQQLEEEIISRFRELGELRERKSKPFRPGVDPVPYAGRIYGGPEMENLGKSAVEFWLTAGRYALQLEQRLASWYGVRHTSLVNSGSSANLVAFTALTSEVWAERRIRPGDEVITVAAGFPTTVAPVLQYGAVPVFVDVLPRTWNIDPSMLEAALSARTKAVMVAHTLGNPFDLEAVSTFCKKHNLWLVEDNCDASGSRYQGKKTGTFGDLATLSFYPPHHMTTGEGGAVLCKTPKMATVVESIRDWGRDCWCPSGKDNTCGKRFQWKLGSLPEGYDHKYTYSHLGYNLKMTDLQAAIGVAQLARLEAFGAARRSNWSFYRQELEPLNEDFMLPESTPNSDPSWFGFLMLVNKESRLSRDAVVQRLEEAKIQTRMLFAGNLVRQPALTTLVSQCHREGRPPPFRVVGKLPHTDDVMNRGLWIGVYPGLTDQMRTYVVNTLKGIAANS